MRSEHSPVGAAGSVSVASGEVRLVYTLHKGLRDGTSGNPHSTHSTATGDGVSWWSRARSLPAQVHTDMGILFGYWGLLWVMTPVPQGPSPSSPGSVDMLSSTICCQH